VVDDMAEMNRRFGQHRRHELVLGTLWGLGAQRVQQLVGTLVDRVPPRIDVRVHGWDDPTGGLRTRDVDLSVIPGPSEIDDALDRVRLWSEPRVAILPTEVAACLGGEVTLAELDAIGWIRFPRPDPIGHRFWRLDDIRGGAPREQGPVWRSPHEIIVAVAQGRGTCTTLASFREQFSFSGVELVSITDVPWVSVDLARRRDHTNGLAAQVFNALARLATDS
jgi:DNA-binding transcriptional LysR family regulator